MFFRHCQGSDLPPEAISYYYERLCRHGTMATLRQDFGNLRLNPLRNDE